ncbi:MBOAT family O-acyltransferase [Aquirufa sp. ROCK2-A2]
MLFNSIHYLIFLPIVYTIFWLIPYSKNFKNIIQKQNFLLLISSYIFYAFWDIRFLLLLIFSTFLDYFSGLKIYHSENPRNKKIWFWISIISNLSVLLVFKYFNFFVANISNSFESIGIHVNIITLQIALPVGISFYTFHGISYVIDIFQNKTEPEKNLLNYSLFVCFFPLLVAGPIERAQHLIPQLKTLKKFNRQQSVMGLQQILWGFFKKIVIADNCAIYVNQIFNNYNEHNSLTLLLGAVLFSFQIYGDFSGYSDIALGSARLFGIELLNNFNYPYFSKNIADFWKRWHISLTSWFRDYLYIPMGGNRVSKLKQIYNTIVVFTVSGFWHGANWTYIFWGFLNSIFILPNNLALKLPAFHNQQSSFTHKMVSSFQIAFNFLLISLIWVFFRSPDIGSAFDFIFQIFTKDFSIMISLMGKRHLSQVLILIFSFYAFEFIGRKHLCPLYQANLWKSKTLKWIFYYMIIFLILYYYRGNSEFIYFQF